MTCLHMLQTIATESPGFKASYLINFGVISLALRYGDAVRDVQSAVELLSTKVGLVLLVLGVMHFIIIASLAKARNADKHTPPRRRAWGEEPV